MAYSSLHIVSQHVSGSKPESDGIDIITPAKEIDPTSTVTNTTFAHFLGATLGISISFSIFQNQFLLNLTTHSSFSSLAHLYAMDSIALVTRLPFGEDESSTAQMADVYIKSFRTVWIVLAVFAGTALVMSAFLKEEKVAQEATIPINLDQAYIV
jgi:hypothetical protein